MIARYRAFWIVVSILCISTVPGWAGVVVDSWQLTTAAGDHVDGPGETEFVDQTVALPFGLTRTVQMGASRSASTYDFGLTGLGASFHFDFDHVRDGDPPSTGPYGAYLGDFAWSKGRIGFHVTEDLTYSIDGLYSLTGLPNGAGLQVSLTEAGSQASLLWNWQYGARVQNQEFHVGGLEGADSNNLIGEPSGLLVGGQSYLFGYEYGICVKTADAGASAQGWLTFDITPEPGAGLLMTLGVVMLLRRRARVATE